MSRKFFYGYRIVAACSVIQMTYLGCLATYGVLFPEFENEFGWSRTVISGAISLNYFLVGLCGIAAGRATDRFGPRIILTICGSLYAVGFMLVGGMTEAWELYLFYGLVCGFGMAAHEVATLSTVARWFVQQRGLMTGIVKAGAGMGQMLVPLVATSLVMIYGWRYVSLLIGAVALTIILVMAQVVRRSPEELGMRPLDAAERTRSENTFGEADFPFSQAVATRQFWILCVARLADMFCLFTVFTHIVPHGIDQGFSPTTSVMVLSTIGGCSILGRILLGTTYDRLSARRSLMICFSLLLSSLIVLQLAGDPRLLFLFAVIYGIAHGGFFAVAPPSVADYFGTRYFGTLYGFVFFIGTIGGTAGPLIAGRIYDVTGSYDIAFLLLTGFAVFGLLLASRLRPLMIDSQ